MKFKKNFFYSSEESNSNMVYVNDSINELLNEMGEIGIWENVTETINKAKKLTNTNSEEYAEFKPKELFGEGLNLDNDLEQIKVDIMNILNDIYNWNTSAQEYNRGDIYTGGSSYYGGSGNADYGNTNTSQTIDGSPVPGAPVPIVTGEDIDTSKEIITDIGSTTPPEAETITPNDPGRAIGTLYVENNGTIDVFDANGKKIDTYTKGKYNVYEYRYDENGNKIAARISPDGEEEKWINLTDTNENVYVVEEGQQGNYSLGESNFPVYDENNNQTGTVDKGNYIVYEVKYDENGNAIAVRISPDGEPEKWLHLQPGQTNGYFYEIGQKGNYFLKDGSVSIYDAEGNIIGTATPGNYTAYGTIYDQNGNVTAIRISKPGEPEQWLYFDANTNGFYIGLGQQGTYSTDGQTLKIFDAQGNPIGTLTDSNVSVYEVKYDNEGRIYAIRISPNGKPEQWIYTTDENGNTVGSYKSIEQMMQLDDGKAIITTTTTKKSNALKYLGILGVLTVALGTTLVVKKKLNQKNEQNYDEYDDYENENYTEEPLEPGEYNVYEFKRDENNNITDARISEDNAKDDLWVHF
mgnify:CR=1 FL=1